MVVFIVLILVAPHASSIGPHPLSTTISEAYPMEHNSNVPSQVSIPGPHLH